MAEIVGHHNVMNY